MAVVKIVFFVYAIVSRVFPSEATRRLYYEPTVTNDDSCLCYPRNQIYASVRDILDPHYNGLERLVVYMYQDVNTNQVKMYTPNSRKQRSIPDLPFEIGDGLIAMNKEVANDIFNTNPNTILLNDKHQTDSDDVHSNTIVLKEIRNKLSDDINSYTIMLNELHDKNSDMVVIPIGMEVGNLEEINHVGFEPDTNVFGDEIVSVPQKDFTMNAFEHYNNVLSGINSADTHDETRPIAKPWHRDVQNEYWQDNVDNSFIYPKKHWEITQELDNNVQIYPKGGTKDHQTHNKVFTNVQDVTPFVGQKQYLTFDKWFIKQMRSFQNVNLPGDIDSINTMDFRKLIQKTLSENNMYVTTDGVLTDSKGTVLDASNLELRPMLLGSPVEYQKVLNGGSGDFKLPKDLPYLEGILVTLVYPPKVLGIIPLGKTSLLSQGSRRKTNKHKNVKITSANVADPHRITLAKDSTPKLVAEPAKEHKGSINTNKTVERPVIKHEFVSQKMKNGKNLKKSHSKLKQNPNGLIAEDNVKPEVGQSRRLIKGNILKKLYDMLSDSRRGYVDYESDDEEVPYFEEVPDFRIIGGNAATGSGAPVSNKGRSGSVII